MDSSITEYLSAFNAPFLSARIVFPLLALAGIARGALARAIKDRREHFFGGMSIFMDRPDKIGDCITLDKGKREPSLRGKTIHNIYKDVYSSFTASGITIPFPH